jgi:glutathione S-transferase
LKQAGHSPVVVKAYGLAPLPDFTRGRKEVKRLTGESLVPVLVLDDGEVIADSDRIAAWARENPAPGKGDAAHPPVPRDPGP